MTVIGDDIRATLPHLRTQAESMMTDVVTIERESGSTWSEATQSTTTTWKPVWSNVPARVTQPPVMSRTVSAGEAATAESPQVRVSMECTGILPDDRVTVVSSSYDPDLVDKVLWVTHARAQSQSITRRLECRWVR